MMQKIGIYLQLWALTIIVGLIIHYTVASWMFDLWETYIYQIPWRH